MHILQPSQDLRRKNISTEIQKHMRVVASKIWERTAIQSPDNHLWFSAPLEDPSFWLQAYDIWQICSQAGHFLEWLSYPVQTGFISLHLPSCSANLHIVCALSAIKVRTVLYPTSHSLPKGQTLKECPWCSTHFRKGTVTPGVVAPLTAEFWITC